MAQIDLLLKIDETGANATVQKLGGVSTAVKGTGDAAVKAGKDYANMSGGLAISIDSIMSLTGRIVRFGEQLFRVFTKDLKITNTEFQTFADSADGFTKNVGEAVVKSAALAGAVRELNKTISDMKSGGDLEQLFKDTANAALTVLRTIGYIGDGLSSISLAVAKTISSVFTFFTDEVEKKIAPLSGMIEAALNNIAMPEGLRSVLRTTKAAFETIATAPRDTMKEITGALTTVNRAFAWIDSTAEKMANGLNSKVKPAIIATKDAIKDLTKEQDDWNDAVDKSIDKAVDLGMKESDAYARIIKKLDDIIAKKTEEREEDAKKRKAEKDRAAEDQRLEQLAKEAEQLAARQAFAISMIQTAASSAVAAMQVVITQLVQGTATASEAIGGMMLSVAQSVFSAMLASSLSAAIDAAIKGAGSVASIPYVGAFLAVGMLGTLLTTFLAARSQMKAPTAAYGLDIRGGIPGVDSVMVQAKAGEKILNPRQVKEYDDLQAARGKRGAGVTFQLVTPQGVTNRVQADRWNSQVLLPSLERLAATGRLDRVLRRRAA